jgi:biotin synthase
MIPEGMVKKLINEEADLFENAQELAFKRSLVLSSPLVMTRGCKVTPLCKYCNWRAYGGVMRNAKTRLTKQEAISRVMHIEQSGVTRVNVLSGWMEDLPRYYFDYISAIKEKTSLKITAIFGAINKEDLLDLKEVGVDCISCGLETTNTTIFRDLKPGDNFDDRLKTLQVAKELGFETETSLIIGLGESIYDVDTGIRLVEQLNISYLSIYSFTPTPFTETETWERPRPYYVARITAAARICLPEIDIAASFGCDNTSVNYAWGIKSGANAFSATLRGTKETPALTGDEINNIRIMWDDSKSVNKTSLMSKH